MPNALLDIDDSILKKKLLIVPNDEEEEAAASSCLPLWSDQPKELNTLFPDANISETAKTVKPQPGACVKTKSTKIGEECKVFVNICTSEVIPAPEDITDTELIAILDSEVPSDFKVPMSLGHGHDEKDKSGADCEAYDVIINPGFFKKMMDNPLFHNFFIITTMEGLEEKYDLSLDKNGWTVLKNKKYLGTIPEQTVRTKVPLVQELSSVRQWTPKDLQEEEGALISEVNTNKDEKSVVKDMPSSSSSKSISSLLYDAEIPHIAEISTKTKRDSKKDAPKHSIEFVNYTKDEKSTSVVEIDVSLPDTCSGNKINVKLSQDDLLIETNKYLLHGYLPHLIDVDNSTGYFVTATKKLLLTLPVER